MVNAATPAAPFKTSRRFGREGSSSTIVLPEFVGATLDFGELPSGLSLRVEDSRAASPSCVLDRRRARQISPLHTAYGVARCGIDFALRHRMMFRMRSVALATEYPTIPSVGYPTIPAVRSSADRIAIIRPFTLTLFSRGLFDAGSRVEVNFR